MALKAVLFDLWETLVTDAPELQRARQLWRAANVRAVLDADGLEVGSDALDAALLGTLHGISRLHDSGKDTDAAGRVAMFASELETHAGIHPHNRTLEALEAAICTMTPPLYPRLMQGAVEALEHVRAQGLKAGLVSNAGVTTAPTLREMLAHYGLAPHLDTLVFSDELMLGKPSPGMFTTALGALGCGPSEAMFIGDSALHDIAGAQALGIHAVQIGGRQIDGIVPNARIDSLAEVGGLLAQHGNLLAGIDRGA